MTRVHAYTYIGAKNTKNEMTLPVHHKQKQLIILSNAGTRLMHDIRMKSVCVCVCV